MPNVDDHGLEVLKKAALDIGAIPKRDYALQTVSKGIFSPPPDADWFSSQFVGLVQTVIYKKGGELGTVLKTITITYTDCTFKNFTAAVT